MALIDNTTPGKFVFDWLDDVMLPELSGNVADFMQVISPVMGAAVITWFVLWAWRYIVEERPLTELVYRFVILTVVCFFAFTAPYYSSTIIPMVNDIPFDLSKPFVGEDFDGLQNSADSLIAENSQIIADMWDKAKFVSWSGVDLNNFMNVSYATLVVGLLGNVYAGIGLFFMVVAKLMINVLLAIGPAFIAAAFFPATKQYFALWVNQIVNYIVLTTLFAVVFAIQLSLINDLTAFTDGRLPPDRVDKIFVVYVISLALLFTVPVIASSVSGGMGLNGLVGSTAQTVSAMARPAAAAGRMLSKPGGAGASGLSKNRVGSMNRPG